MRVVLMSMVLACALGGKPGMACRQRSNHSRDIVVSGTVTDEHGHRLRHLYVAIGGRGTTTDKAGRYRLRLTVDDTVHLVHLWFYDPASRTRYARGGFEQGIYLSPSINRHLDFVVVKVPSPQ